MHIFMYNIYNKWILDRNVVVIREYILLGAATLRSCARRAINFLRISRHNVATLDVDILEDKLRYQLMLVTPDKRSNP